MSYFVETVFERLPPFLWVHVCCWLKGGSLHQESPLLKVQIPPATDLAAKHCAFSNSDFASSTEPIEMNITKYFHMLAPAFYHQHHIKVN